MFDDVKLQVATALKLAEQTGRDLEFAEADVGMVLHGANGSILATNAAAERIFGATLQQMIDRHAATPWQIINLQGESIALTETPAFKALCTQTTAQATLGYYKLNGELIWLTVKADPLFAAPHLPPFGAIVTFSIDRSTVQPASDAPYELEQCLTELQTLLDAAPVGIAIATDPACRLLRLNTHYQQMLGLVPTATAAQIGIESASIPFRVLRDGKEVPQSALPMQIAASEGVSIRDVELQLVRSDGVAIDLLTSATPLLDEQGRVWGCIGVHVDITARKQLEAQLQASEARVRLATTAANLGLWCWQPDRKQLELSDECKMLFGFSPAEEVSHRQVIDRLHPDDRLPVEAALARTLADQDEYDIEYRLIWPNGSTRWIAAKGRSFGGTTRQVIGTAQDITRHKVAAQEREQLLRRAQSARRQAETASRTKDEFLAIVSHELRSPLNAILGWAKLLRTRSYDAATVDRALEVIDRNAQAQSQLIEDLLDVSRIIRGKVRLQSYPVNLTNLVATAIDAICPAADSKQIHLETDLTAALGIVGDRDRLQQIVGNLLSNAIKFTPSGGRVAIQLERDEESQISTSPTSHCRLTITDTGIGIDPEFLPYVFDRFRQAQPTTTRSQGGLGLGLAIVRNLVELHGGTVQAESLGAGQGTSFIVQLPIATLPLPESIERPNSVNLAVIDGLRILVVDDEADSRDMLVSALEQYSASLAAAASVDEALHLLSQFQPDVIVSDIAMPDADGYTLMRAIQAATEIPVLAVTALAKPEDRQQVLAAGFAQHFVKPIDPAELARSIAQIVVRDSA